MGVVSNGMLCSGDELGLTADADGILILPADAPIGRPLDRAYGDTVLDVDVKPNRGDALSIVGLAREVAAVTGAPLRFPPTDVDRDRPPDRRTPARRGPRPRPVPALRRPLGERRARRSVARPRPDAPAGGRPAADQQRRRRLELRHGRARQADPHVRCRRGPRRPIIVRRARPRASASRRSTTSSASSTPRRCSSPTRRGPLGIAGRHGRRRLRGRGGDHRRRRRVGHLRPDQHPPDGLPLRPPVRGQPALREGPGVPPRPDRCRPDGPPHRRMGRWRGRAGRRRFEPDRAAARARRVPAGAGQPAAGHGLRGRRAARAPRPGRDRDGAGRHQAPGSASPPATKPLDVEPGDAEVVDATVPSWRRDLAVEADITEEVIRIRGYDLVPATLPHTPMPPYRHDPLEVRDTRPRDAGRRRADRGRDLRPGRAEARRALPGPRRRRARGRTGAARRPAGRSPSPTRCRASTRSSARASSAACSRSSRRTCARAATTSRSSRSARATARRATRRPTSGGGSASP